MNTNFPGLIVFDLDFTLWDCGGTWCDCTSPPFLMQDGLIRDSIGRHIRFYDDVWSLLDECDSLQIPMAIASRTEQPSWARELLGLLGATDRFSYAEIYPSGKRRHFRSLAEASGVDYQNMLFFDDEMRNIRDVGELGVTAIFVEDGVNRELWQEALRRHASKKR